MTAPDPTQHLIAYMSTLADAARIRILHLLAEQSLLVSDLGDVLQLPQSTVSRHLKQLSDQGWLVSRREGTSHLYRMLTEELDPIAKQLWEIARRQTQDQPAIAQDRLRLASVRAARQRDSRSFFAGAARDWDRLRGELFGTSFSTEALLALIDPELTVADLGCGTGAVVQQLAPHVKRVIGVDNSREMLAAARQRVGELTNVSLECGDLVKLPMPDGVVDAALMILSLSYAADVQQALQEARRILRPKGKLVLVDVLHHDRDDFRRQMGQVRMGFATEDLVPLLAEAGFSTTVARALHPEAQAKGPALFLVRAEV